MNIQEANAAILDFLCKVVKDNGYTISYVENPKRSLYFSNNVRFETCIKYLSLKREIMTDGKACILGKPEAYTETADVDGWVKLDLVADKFHVTLIDEDTEMELKGEDFDLNSGNVGKFLNTYGRDPLINEILNDFNTSDGSYFINLTNMRKYIATQDEFKRRVKFSGDVKADDMDLTKAACVTLYRYPTKEENGSQVKETSKDLDYDITEYGICFLRCMFFTNGINDLAAFVLDKLKTSVDYVPFTKEHFSFDKEKDIVSTDIYGENANDKKDDLSDVDAKKERKPREGRKYKSVEELMDEIEGMSKVNMLRHILRWAKSGDISRIVKLAINKGDNSKMGREQWLQIARSKDFLSADDLKRAITAVVGDYEKKMAEKSKEAGN